MLYMINHGAVSYGANTILTNINFEINAGQKIAVVGRNGCGKTTLLKLIEGEVELEKRDSDEDIYMPSFRCCLLDGVSKKFIKVLHCLILPRRVKLMEWSNVK